MELKVLVQIEKSCFEVNKSKKNSRIVSEGITTQDVLQTGRQEDNDSI